MSKRKHETDSDSDFEPSDFFDMDTCDKKTRTEYLRLKKKIQESEPNIINILSLNILDEDKIELLQLYEIYGNMEDEVSISKLDLKKTILSKTQQSLIKYTQYSKYSKKEHDKFRKEIQLLEQFNEAEELKYDIINLETSPENKRTIYSEYKRMTSLPFTDDELPRLKNWLKWSLSIPHDRMKISSLQKKELSTLIKRVSDRMDEELYGMEKVKEQILLFLNSRIVNPNMRKCSLGLLGPPGCGKTTIVRILADILNYPLEQISLGGIQSPEYLKGHQYTYIGAEPGEIVKCLARMKVKNGILFFDEYDKVENKEVCSALLHITDSSQNSRFRDNYLGGINIDLSNLWFFYSMNKKPVDDALADRIFYVEIEGYTQGDKFFIVNDYLLRKLHKNMNWKPNSVTMEKEAVEYLIDKVSPPSNPGIRNLDHCITTIGNKLNFLYHHQNAKGELQNFRNMFNIGEKLSFPFVLRKDAIDGLLA
jgi:ATP-dependent Lon protease